MAVTGVPLAAIVRLARGSPDGAAFGCAAHEPALQGLLGIFGRLLDEDKGLRARPQEV
jgi:hypothetical protein